MPNQRDFSCGLCLTYFFLISRVDKDKDSMEILGDIKLGEIMNVLGKARRFK